jgi:hypothetical protein
MDTRTGLDVVEKIQISVLPVSNSRLLRFQPVASRYTDCDISAYCIRLCIGDFQVIL